MPGNIVIQHIASGFARMKIPESGVIPTDDWLGNTLAKDLSVECIKGRYVFEPRVKDFPYFYGDFFANMPVTKDLLYYHHSDRLGSGSVITSHQSGNPVHMLAYIPYGETLLDISDNTGYQTPYQFAGYEKDQESGLSYAGARYYSARRSIFTSVDPMWAKYPSISPYAYCANNPIMFVDPDGRDWYKAENGQTMWVKSQEKTYTDANGAVWNNIGKNYLSVNGNKATLFTQQTNNNGELYLQSSSYNLSEKENASSLTNTLGKLLDVGSSVAGTIGTVGENSNATFRITNSKGKLDFKFYGNGWWGNQWVTPTALSKVGKVIKTGGSFLGAASAGLSLGQISNSNTNLKNAEHGVDAAMSIVGMLNVYGLAASVYYSSVIKNYPNIRQSVNRQCIDRADMMQRGFIPVGHPGFPFK